MKAVPWGLIALVALSFSGTRSGGQTKPMEPQTAQPTSSWSSSSTSGLPDSPGTVLARTGDPSGGASENSPSLAVRNIENTSVMRPARRNHRVVRPYEEAQPLSGGDKIELSIMSRATPGEAFATVFSAAWSHWRNTHPNYGTNGEAFEKRLGALAIKQTSQSFFSYGVYAAAFHDDPRYYVMGSTVPVRKRAIYSATRTIITQKDDGSRAINWPRLAGIATATALTTAYYPKENQGFGNETKAFVGSVGASVMTDELHEFIGDAMRMLHRNP